MGYLIERDYRRVIQDSELKAITGGGDASLRIMAENTALAKVKSYLRQKYDLAQEFQDTLLFSMDVIYKAGQRIYLDATAYSAAATYALKALTLQGGNVYACKTAIVTPEAFTIGKWDLLGKQYAIFFVTYPAPVFNYLTFYLKESPVFWEDKTYAAARESLTTSHEDELQAGLTQNIVIGNPFPGTTKAGIEMWGTGTAYVVAAGTYPTDTAKWTAGDNRDQEMVELLLDIVVYNRCKTIAPENVPEVRHNAWLAAIDTMKKYAKGDLTASLPLLQPKSGNRIRHGSNVKNINTW